MNLPDWTGWGLGGFDVNVFKSNWIRKCKRYSSSVYSNYEEFDADTYVDPIF